MWKKRTPTVPEEYEGKKMGGDIKGVPKICRKSQQQCSPLFKTRELLADNCYTEFTISKPFVLKHFIL